ncbi:MAG: response regulator [Verrucomicrobia bacterium]|nr:response regulator [Verrucomicrobiota bacterium]
MNSAGRPWRVVVVDDEPHARDLLAALLAEHPDFALVGTCGDGRSALDRVEETSPDLLFLDVQMPELDGFEVVAALDECSPPLVVFVTAFDRHAVRAFEVHALDYLLKPFGPDRFLRALERARAVLADAPLRCDLWTRSRALALHAPGASSYLQRLLLRESGRVFIRAVSELDFVESEGNYLRLHFGADSHLQREKLGLLEERLDPARFARCHRSYLVNLDRVRELRPAFHGNLSIVLRSGREIPLGRPYRDSFVGRLAF